ncbi:MAG TPA: TOMM precursor leader peptide-binding protein [Ktedonosporobacter sp.]|nr:TOMM precursor leader peptide-binding protein [Ktedonosporobacter sp.]
MDKESRSPHERAFPGGPIPAYRMPALKRTWIVTGNRTSRSVSFAPLAPGLRAFMLHRVSPPQLRLLGLLTGEYRTEELEQRLCAEFSHLPPGAVASMLNQLDRAGLLEEADVQPPADWTPAYVERYTRHLAVFAGYERPGLSRFDQQQRLRDARVAVLGVGGTGSWIALLLAQLGIGHLTLVDEDRITSSNLTRQALYTERDIGRCKVVAASEALRAINSEIQLTAVARSITTEEELAELCQGSNLVIITFGPFLLPDPSRLQRACVRQGIPCVAMGGLHLGPLVIPGQTACFECVRLALDAYFPTPTATGGNADAETFFLERGYHAIFAPLIASCIGLGVTEIIKFLAGFAPSTLENGLLYLNPTDLSITRLATPRHPACPLCGTEEEFRHL